jgi:hypothetical protein
MAGIQSPLHSASCPVALLEVVVAALEVGLQAADTSSSNTSNSTKRRRISSNLRFNLRLSSSRFSSTACRQRKTMVRDTSSMVSSNMFPHSPDFFFHSFCLILCLAMNTHKKFPDKTNFIETLII